MSGQGRVILVTGASGLVGHAIREHADELGLPNTRWVFATSKDADLRDPASTKALFDRVRPTHVLNLAARVGGLYANLKYKVEFWRENIAMQDNIFACSFEHEVSRLVTCLSTCIFPDGAPLPMEESIIMDAPPHRSNRAYGFAKRMGLLLGELYNEQHGTNFAAIAPCNVFGPGDNFSLDDGHVLAGLMHKCYLAKQEGKPFVIWGSGKPLRQFIYNKDLAKLMVWYMLDCDSTETITLAPDESDEISIADAAKLVARSMDFTVSDSVGD
jgi:GDP-L-fucose synthase